MKKIAILGSTGHIAKNLIYGLSATEKYELVLFARNISSLRLFIDGTELLKQNTNIVLKSFNDFKDQEYDVIINCIGVGDPAKLKKIGGAIFTLTEEFDNLVMSYLENNTKALYINFSSGIAYGSNFNTPADENKTAIININNIAPTDYYSISKINTEAKHRAYSNYNIVDLRVFGFFSKFIDLKTPYFLSDIVNCIKEQRVFVTGRNDMVRDYIHPDDLLQLIERCINMHNINDVFDVYSLEPITKFQIISYFEKNHNLQVLVEQDKILTSVTGLKSNYYSLNKKSDIIGYRPRYRSIDAIVSQLEDLF
ncbi:NAD-dependent epimerase/dehydratase family protein [Paenibacillus sp. NPDC056579]|uniref:NAD-dependent epimerase/dehydratase family protein n=1 Tax=Paenibacillus sp. NPDC056579 TaxID=3345871 RepID=UPI0036B938EC